MLLEYQKINSRTERAYLSLSLVRLSSLLWGHNLQSCIFMLLQWMFTSRYNVLFSMFYILILVVSQSMYVSFCLFFSHLTLCPLDISTFINYPSSSWSYTVYSIQSWIYCLYIHSSVDGLKNILKSKVKLYAI